MKKAKFGLLILVLTAFTTAIQAQAFFKPMPKPIAGRSVIANAQAAPTVQNAFRPVLNIASYAIGDNSLLNGGGMSLQHLKYDEASDRWSSVWSINAVAWYKTSFSGDGQAFAMGLTGGVFNNLIMIGVGKTLTNNPGETGFFGTIGIGVNLNN